MYSEKSAYVFVQARKFFDRVHFRSRTTTASKAKNEHSKWERPKESCNPCQVFLYALSSTMFTTLDAFSALYTTYYIYTTFFFGVFFKSARVNFDAMFG